MLTEQKRRTLWLLATVAFALYALLPGVALALSQAEASFCGEIFGWNRNVTKPALEALHDSGSQGRAWPFFVGLCAALFGVYAYALKLSRDEQDARAQRLILLSGAAFLLVQLIAPVMLSSDVFLYALYGRVLSVYHGNPYDLAPVIAAGDPFMKLFGQDYLPSWYGPLWNSISAGVAGLGGRQVGLTVLLFRLTAIGAALGCAGLILASLRRMAPERATQGLVFFLWNPLLVIETGLSGHNDAVMLLFVLLAVWLHLRGFKAGAIVALLLSALVKFITGMLLPLYVLLVFRQSETWRERLRFIARSGAAAALVGLATITFTRSHSGSATTHAAVAADFYINNFHELLFKGLRRALGEDAESVGSPVYFQGWWLAAKTNTCLRLQPGDEGTVRQSLAAGTRVVVIAPQESEQWVRAYDPASHQRGFVNLLDFTDSARPSDADDLAKQFDTMTADRPTPQLANHLLRAVLWLAFAAFGLLCAWRTNTFEEFLVWSAAALLASYYLITTGIWPWYANWAVALGALATHRQPARLAAILSACVLTLYVTIGFEGPYASWVYSLRSLPAFVLPLVLFIALCRRPNLTPALNAGGPQ